MLDVSFGPGDRGKVWIHDVPVGEIEKHCIPEMRENIEGAYTTGTLILAGVEITLFSKSEPKEPT